MDGDVNLKKEEKKENGEWMFSGKEFYRASSIADKKPDGCAVRMRSGKKEAEHGVGNKHSFCQSKSGQGVWHPSSFFLMPSPTRRLEGANESASSIFIRRTLYLQAIQQTTTETTTINNKLQLEDVVSNELNR